jgi:hypothetical protein
MNYYTNTVAQFECVNHIELSRFGNPDFISETGSKYWQIDGYVYRLSDHWGIVSDCLWLIDESKEFTINEFYGNASFGKCKLEDFLIFKKEILNIDYDKEYQFFEFGKLFKSKIIKKEVPDYYGSDFRNKIMVDRIEKHSNHQTEFFGLKELIIDENIVSEYIQTR